MLPFIHSGMVELYHAKSSIVGVRLVLKSLSHSKPAHEHARCNHVFVSIAELFVPKYQSSLSFSA
jgi:hypothetical protein